MNTKHLTVLSWAAAQTLAGWAWDATTPQPNKYELPPASPAVVAEAKAAKVRLKTVSPSAIIGHRGEREFCQENTVPAFAAAVAGGFGFECDLWLSNDGVIFITHDSMIGGRNGHTAQGSATNMVWRGSLEKSDVGEWKSPVWRGTRMPTIDDVLPWAGENHVIELHVCDWRWHLILPKLKEVLARHPNVPARNVHLCGSRPGRDWVKKNLPGHPCVSCKLLRKGWRVIDEPYDMKSLLDDINPEDAEVWSPRWDEDLLTAEIVERVHRKGVKVSVWTVNDAASAWAALGRGVDIILTDRPSSLFREMKAF